MNRIAAASRLHLISWHGLVLWPWGILLSSFLINVVIFAAIGDQGQGQNTPGGLVSIYIVVFVAFVQLVTQGFPFALGLSVTRRSFYLGTALLALGQAVLFGFGLYLFKLVEDATDGWGLSLRFFGIPFLTQDNGILQILVFTVPFVLAGFAGMVGGVIFQRWGTNGVYTLMLTSIIGTGGLAALITWQQQWMELGNWFADQPTLTLIVGWPILIAAALAGSGYAAIRRATA